MLVVVAYEKHVLERREPPVMAVLCPFTVGLKVASLCGVSGSFDDEPNPAVEVCTGKVSDTT